MIAPVSSRGVTARAGAGARCSFSVSGSGGFSVQPALGVGIVRRGVDAGSGQWSVGSGRWPVVSGRGLPGGYGLVATRGMGIRTPVFGLQSRIYAI